MDSFLAVPDDPTPSSSLGPLSHSTSTASIPPNQVDGVTTNTAAGETTHGGGGELSAAGTVVTSKAAVAAAPPPPPPSGDDGTSKKAWSLEEANEEIALLLEGGKVTLAQVSALQGLLRDHVALTEKVTKLKSLLGRSAKAQREAKVDLEATQKRLDQALREVERLNQKVERLANRPTHLELLADFETNFDRALLSVGQTGGQDTAAAPSAPSPFPHSETAVVDSMLMQELAESKSRVEKLESLNTALLHRSSQLEQDAKQFRSERDAANQTLSRMQLELRMAKMEAEHASRALQDKAASLAEMQIEIDLVTRASMDANVRAAQGEAAVKSVKTDRQHVQQLELQVQALQEWALASAEAKRLSTERIQILEQKLQQYESHGTTASIPDGNSPERSIFVKSGSLVIGAGDKGFAVIELSADHAKGIHANERVLLRWKFDLANPTLHIDFNILKGKCETTVKQTQADYLIQNRHVLGGAGGETESAFAVQNACTLLWSNEKSWVRPRTVKYTVEALAVHD